MCWTGPGRASGYAWGVVGGGLGYPEVRAERPGRSQEGSGRGTRPTEGRDPDAQTTGGGPEGRGPEASRRRTGREPLEGTGDEVCRDRRVGERWDLGQSKRSTEKRFRFRYTEGSLTLEVTPWWNGQGRAPTWGRDLVQSRFRRTGSPTHSLTYYRGPYALPWFGPSSPPRLSSPPGPVPTPTVSTGPTRVSRRSVLRRRSSPRPDKTLPLLFAG